MSDDEITENKKRKLKDKVRRELQENIRIEGELTFSHAAALPCLICLSLFVIFPFSLCMHAARGAP